MTKSEIFIAAHKEAKLNRFNHSTYAERFAQELKIIHVKKRILKERAAKALLTTTVAKTTVLEFEMKRDEVMFGNVNPDDYWN